MKSFKVMNSIVDFKASEKDAPEYVKVGSYVKYVSLGENLSWEEAKRISRENTGSWIVKQ